MKQQKSTAKIKSLNFKDFSHETTKNLHNKTVGILGEDFACEYLKDFGFKVFERNFAMKFGEIDIVAISHETKKVYIVEVKTSISHENSKINAIENATFKKLQKVARVGEFYIKEKFSHETPFSVCVCAVYLNSDLSLKNIDFIKDIEI